MDADAPMRAPPVHGSMPSAALLRLRERAVALLGAPAPEAPDAETRRLIHELRVHQLELEMQNDELRAAEHELALSQAHYRDLFELAPAAYVNLDPRGVIYRANRAAGVLFGVDATQLLGRPLAEYTNPRDSAILGEYLRAAARGSHSTELNLRRADGSSVWARMESRRTPNADCWSVLTDISHKKRAEEGLQRANQELEARVYARTEELAARNRELEAALAARAAGDAERSALAARLREAERLESLGLVAGGIAHDFNNLLTGVLAHSDLLLARAGLEDHVDNGLRTIRRAAQNAAELTRQLLVYAGHGQLSPKVVPLDELIEGSLRLLRARAPDHVLLQCELAPDGPLAIHADSVQVEQVITNLLTNALEAIGGHAGRVVVRSRLVHLDENGLTRYPQRKKARPGPFVVLEIDDTGPGIEAATLSRIFDPFFTTKFTGRGLGLASVLGIVHAHDAALRVRSAPGRGTSFEIAWPLAEMPVAARARTAAREATWTGSGRVLLVDDDAAVRRTLASQLRHLGFDVAEAAEGVGALALARRGVDQFRLAVVDRTMPGMSGDELREALHELEPELPVLLVSGYSSAGPVDASARVAFLGKPMTLADLTQALRSLLDCPRNPSAGAPRGERNGQLSSAEARAPREG